MNWKEPCDVHDVGVYIKALSGDAFSGYDFAFIARDSNGCLRYVVGDNLGAAIGNNPHIRFLGPLEPPP